MAKTFKKIILDDLKAQGLNNIVKKVKSIKYRSFAGGDAVDVDTENLFKSEREQLENVLNDYKMGRFDGMNDIYEYSKNESNKERQAKYVSLQNTFTDEVRNHIKSKLANEWDITDDATAREKMGVWYDQAVWRLLQQLESI